MSVPADVRYALLSILCWSTVATVFKLSLRDINSFTLLFYSTWIGTFVLFVAAKVLHSDVSLRKSFDFKSFALGSLNPLLYYLLLFRGYELLLAQEAMVLNFLWPLVLVLLAWPIWGKVPHLSDLVAIFISFMGAVVIITKGEFAWSNQMNPTGLFCVLASTIVWSLYWLFNTKNTVPAVVKLYWQFVCGAALLSVLSFFPYFELMSLNKMGLFGVSYVGFFEMGIAFIFWLKALESTDSPALIGNLIYLSPMISFIWISNVLGEPLGASCLYGFIFILIGIGIQSWGEKKKLSARYD